MTEENPTTPPPEDTPAPPEPDKAEATGYAVYDETELRFRGRVHPTKGEAGKAKADIAKGLRRKNRLTVRAV